YAPQGRPHLRLHWRPRFRHRPRLWPPRRLCFNPFWRPLLHRLLRGLLVDHGRLIRRDGCRADGSSPSPTRMTSPIAAQGGNAPIYGAISSSPPRETTAPSCAPAAASAV